MTSQNFLITRPIENSNDLVSFLKTNGHKVFVEPLFTIKNIFTEKLSQPFAVIITSANACDNFLSMNYSKSLKIYSIGKNSSEKLANAGYFNIFFAKEMSAKNLLDLIIIDTKNIDFDFSNNEILYFCGDNLSLDIAKELINNGIKSKKIISYNTIYHNEFSTELLQKTKNISFDLIFIYSINSAKNFAKLSKHHNLVEYFAQSKIIGFSEKIIIELEKNNFNNCCHFESIPILKKFYNL